MTRWCEKCLHVSSRDALRRAETTRSWNEARRYSRGSACVHATRAPRYVVRRHRGRSVSSVMSARRAPFARRFALDGARAARHARGARKEKGAAEQPNGWPGVAGPRTSRARDKLAQTHRGSSAGVNVVRGPRTPTCRVVSRASALRTPRGPSGLLSNSVAMLNSGASSPRVGLPESMRARNQRPAGCRAHARIEPKRCRPRSPRCWGPAAGRSPREGLRVVRLTPPARLAL